MRLYQYIVTVDIDDKTIIFHYIDEDEALEAFNELKNNGYKNIRMEPWKPYEMVDSRIRR